MTTANTSLDETPNLDGDSSIQAGSGSDIVFSGPKRPNSYKYPQLRKYFDFGPWIGRNRKALCLHCHTQTSSSQPDRLLKHLNRCNSLTDEDKAIVSDLMNERTANKRRPPSSSGIKIKRELDDNGDTDYYPNEEDEDQSSTPASDLILPNSASRNMDRKSQIDEALTKFILACRIPLKAIHSREFINFLHELDPGYHIPSREHITNVLIPGLLNI